MLESQWETWVCCSVGKPCKNHLQLKSHGISFIHNIYFSDPIFFKFWTEHGSTTVMLCTKFETNRVIENKLWTVNFCQILVWREFERICYIATSHYFSVNEVWPEAVWLHGYKLCVPMKTFWLLPVFTHWFLGDILVILKILFPNSLDRILAWALIVKLLSGECHRTSLMRCQYWFR